MAGRFGRSPPRWFWVVAVLLILWGLAGLGAFAADALMRDDAVAALPEVDRALRAARPGWFLPVYAVATGAGLAGSIALLMRRRAATALYMASLVAVVVQFGWVFAATDLVARKGAWVAIFPAVILGIAVLQLLLARRGVRRGWLL